jgi:beta-barrel assembly-enhancing protease
MVRIWAGMMSLAVLACVAGPAVATGGSVESDREETRINKEFEHAAFADAYLASITERILAAAPNRPAQAVRMRALRDPDPFIFCLDNGAAYVSTGLLARLQNDSQLAMLLGPELSSVFAPNTSLQQEYDAKVRRQAGPKILAVIATAGLAVFPMMNSEGKAYDAHIEAVVLENDKVGLDWARRAGFDPTQASAAAQRLAAVLEKEGQVGPGRLASPVSLERRRDQLARAVEALPADAAIKTIPDTVDPLRAISHRLSLDLARDLVGDNRAVTFTSIIDRIDLEYGVSGDSACLRARFLRQQSVTAQVPQEVFAAYLTCTAQPDAPVSNYRELGLLYRDSENAPAAIRAFEDYLQRAPRAADAPIIKLYIEELRAKPQ